jgi:CubicO group peptidase (beta-lactamase class C family)
MLKKHRPEASFAPGRKFEYSNTGYVMLASIIEQVSGMPFRDYVKENIFDVLCMERTRVVNRRYRPERIDDYAYSHVFSIADGGYTVPDSVERFRYVYYLDGIVGDGCVNSTVEDLITWDRALYTDRLVSRETLEEAYAPPVLSEDSSADYSCGWHIRNTPERRVMSHGGSYAGYINKFVRMVDTKQTVIILTNNSFKYYDMFDCIVDVLRESECTLPPVWFDVELRSALVNNSMGELKDEIETLLGDTLNVRISGRVLNNMGYELLSAGRNGDAIELLKLNVRLFPEVANAYDSLGEAYMASNENGLAIENYEKSLQLNPKNRNAEQMLKRLRRNN